MKKLIIGIIALAILFLLYYQTDSQDSHEGKRYTENAINEKNVAVEQAKDTSIYEANLRMIKQYVELVYTHDKQTPNITGISEIVSQDILADVQKTLAADTENRYETKVKNARYFVNKDSALAIFNLKTITKVNTSEQSYLLEVKLKDGKIVKVKTMTRLGD